MSKKIKIILPIINVLLLISGCLGLVYLLFELELLPKIIAYSALLVFSLGSIIFSLLGKEKLAKSSFIFNVTTVIILAIFFILNACGLFDDFSDLERIKSLILSSGGYGVLICVLIQILQVVILPVPAIIFHLAIASVYGWAWAFVICYLSTVLGSVIAFSIGRIFGRGAVEWCVGKDTAKKYSNLLGKKGKIPFIIMQLLPFFPDDVLCMIAGLSNMTYRFFIFTIALTKPLYIFLACYFGRGNLIPFKGWGIVFWIAVFVIIIAVVIVYLINQKKINDYFINKFSKKTRKKKNRKNRS